jgi:hypothetical protein
MNGAPLFAQKKPAPHRNGGGSDLPMWNNEGAFAQKKKAASKKASVKKEAPTKTPVKKASVKKAAPKFVLAQIRQKN